MSTKLYVGNLSFNTSVNGLETMFGEAGTVLSARIIEDRDTGRSRGFGFVEMSTETECEDAISSFNGREIDGRTLKVNEAKEQTPRTGNGFSSGFGGGKSGFGSSFQGNARAYNKIW